jgi:hypothetical protein
MRQTQRFEFIVTVRELKEGQLVVMHYTVLRNCTEEGKTGEGNNCVRRKNGNERTEGVGTEREK